MKITGRLIRLLILLVTREDSLFQLQNDQSADLFLLSERRDIENRIVDALEIGRIRFSSLNRLELKSRESAEIINGSMK